MNNTKTAGRSDSKRPRSEKRDRDIRKAEKTERRELYVFLHPALFSGDVQRCA